MGRHFTHQKWNNHLGNRHALGAMEAKGETRKVNDMAGYGEKEATSQRCYGINLLI